MDYQALKSSRICRLRFLARFDGLTHLSGPSIRTAARIPHPGRERTGISVVDVSLVPGTRRVVVSQVNPVVDRPLEREQH